MVVYYLSTFKALRVRGSKYINKKSALFSPRTFTPHQYDIHNTGVGRAEGESEVSLSLAGGTIHNSIGV